MGHVPQCLIAGDANASSITNFDVTRSHYFKVIINVDIRQMKNRSVYSRPSALHVYSRHLAISNLLDAPQAMYVSK